MVIVVLCSIVFLSFELNLVGTWGVNKTVGWAWDITNFAPLVFIPVLIICLLGYCIMWMFKLKVNKVIALLNLSFLLLALGLIFSYISFIMSLNALVMAIVNFTFGVTVKMYEKKKSLE